MRGFETEAARLEDFRQFFNQEVLDFSAWHAERNEERALA